MDATLWLPSVTTPCQRFSATLHFLALFSKNHRIFPVCVTCTWNIPNEHTRCQLSWKNMTKCKNPTLYVVVINQKHLKYSLDRHGKKDTAIFLKQSVITLSVVGPYTNGLS